MDRHIQVFLNKVSFVIIAIATLIIFRLLIHTPDTCVDLKTNPNPKPHLHFPTSSCDASHRTLTTLQKHNRRIWSTKNWLRTVSSFSDLFVSLQSSDLLSNHSKILVVSAGPGQAVMALNQLGVPDVMGIELMDSPPLVSRADPHNLPFFDHVFDIGFTAHLDQALFPTRYVREMERTVRVGGVCVVLVEECGTVELNEVLKLFRRSKFIGAKNVTLTGEKMTRILMKATNP